MILFTTISNTATHNNNNNIIIIFIGTKHAKCTNITANGRALPLTTVQNMHAHYNLLLKYWLKSILVRFVLNDDTVVQSNIVNILSSWQLARCKILVKLADRTEVLSRRYTKTIVIRERYVAEVRVVDRVCQNDDCYYISNGLIR
jgi:hypothetical protein